MHTFMSTVRGLPLVRLMHLVSPSLPTGAFAYSQGIEAAVDLGWVSAVEDLEDWLAPQMHSTLARLDLPLLLRMHRATAHDDWRALAHWSDMLIASRETGELRLEESNRGRALIDLLVNLEVRDADARRSTIVRCQVAGFAFAACRWGIGAADTALGYAWAWLENLVLAAVKIIPLGQTQGQRVLSHLAAELPAVLATARTLKDHEIGAGNPAMALASCRHETQYTRLFRS